MLIDDLDGALRSARDILDERGKVAARRVLDRAAIEIQETGYDNWNGGTRIYTIFLRVAAAEFARLDGDRESLEQEVQDALKPVVEAETDDWFSIRIVPRRSAPERATVAVSPLTRDVRTFIIDKLLVEKVHYAGRMKETQFLERLYDLANLPSTDTRCKTARDDIYLHRDHFCDGDDDWFFYDNRFELMTGTDDNFLRFLCEMVHSAVRPDKGEAAKIVEIINGELSLVGWRLVGADEIAGRPIYVARSDGSPAPIALARAAADFLDADYMHREINRAERAMYDDPALAIGTAKELVETCCKTLLRHMSVEVAIDADTPQLARTLLRQLSLSPETVPEDAAGAETIRALLGNFANIPHRLAELRNPYGSGHGKDGRFRGLAPRHAKLAVTAAVAFVSFVVDVYKHRSDAPVTRPP